MELRKYLQMVKMLSFIGMTFLISCSSDSYLCEPDETAVNVSQNGESFRLSQDEAVTKACETLGKKDTRSEGLASVDYIMRNEPNISTRGSLAKADTLAYIINFPENGGFAVIAIDKRVQHVLAYAGKGHFDKNIPIIKDMFISRLGDFIDKKCISTRSIDPGMQDPPTPQTYDTIPPLIEINLSQFSPWDKYVVAEHPTSPVGCVPVAVTNIISHCADSLHFGGKTYYFGPIVRGIKAGPPVITYPHAISGPGFTSEPIGGFTMNYYTAIDKIAYLMYDIGKPGNLSVSYDFLASSANSVTAYNFIKKLGYEVTAYYSCSNRVLYSLVKSDNLVYVRGTTPTSSGIVGHAWVIDGCAFPNVGGTTENYYDEVFFYCNWGWGGSCNGYFWGDIYSTQKGAFDIEHCFGVKIKSTFKKR